MRFKKGDKVETIDDEIKGVVSKIEEGNIVVKTSDGFKFYFKENELMLIERNDELRHSIFNDVSLESIKREKEGSSRHKIQSIIPKDRNKPMFVVDLHSHELTDTTKGMTPFDILNMQLQSAKSQLEFAMRKQMLKMVFIHGVGEGVLKQELHTMLGRYNNLEYYDADFKTYGLGATEVRIFQNPSF